MEVLDSHCRETILKKLSEVFEEEQEILVRVLYYLKEEEKNNIEISPALRALKILSKDDQAFEIFARYLAEDAKTIKSDDRFRETISFSFENVFVESNEESGSGSRFDLNLSKFAKIDYKKRSGLIGYAIALSKLPKSSKDAILKLAKPLTKQDKQLDGNSDQMSRLAGQSNGSVAIIGLAMVVMSYEAYDTIKRWRLGEISGKRCCKIVIDSISANVACLAGGHIGSEVGSAVGSAVGPISTCVGGVVGAVFSAISVKYLSDKITQYIFGLRKDESLQNAYKYFGLNINASNSEINTAFRKKCLEHHPDKGGNTQDFHFTKVNFDIIMAAKYGS